MCTNLEVDEMRLKPPIAAQKGNDRSNFFHPGTVQGSSPRITSLNVGA